LDHGCAVIPEGLIEFIPEMGDLISELNEALVEHGEFLATLEMARRRDFIVRHMTAKNAQLFASLPDYIEEMLLLDRDSHGNLQVSRIPTERLLIDMVAVRIKELDETINFQPQSHFFGYEGRCGAPSLFDAFYTYNLGLTAGSLVLANKSGYLASITDFNLGGRVLAIPLTSMLQSERREGRDEFVIRKALVETDSPAFRYYASRREDWAGEDRFTSPGPRQMWGPTARQMPISVALNQGYEDLSFLTERRGSNRVTDSG
jgi:pyrophosphate--fructose-6-phosphate 1-phosphotransferase